ncbi:MAG: GIY-YIG nuclease family protein [Methylocella sp.]
MIAAFPGPKDFFDSRPYGPERAFVRFEPFGRKPATPRYGCMLLLVWLEFHVTMPDTIAREKQIKAGSRQKKLALIEARNPAWRDLYEDLA